MRLHQLTLRDVKGVRERTVTFPDHGVVVIEGPNEVGKSTLLEAFDRLLDPRAKATSRSGPVRALQPVGRDVGPYVEAEFTVGVHRVRYAKQWLREPSTTLEILEPTRAQLTGPEAQERLDTIIAESLDPQLWRALRFAQAGELGQVALTDSGVLTEALDGASGADLHTEAGADLLERVETEYLRYFTPTGRPARDLKDALAAAHEARDAAVAAFHRVQETEDLVREDEQLRARADGLRAGLPDLEQAVATARERVARVTELEAVYAEARHRLQHAAERSQRSRQDLEVRTRTVAAVAQAEARLDTVEQERVDLAREVEVLQESLAPLEQRVAQTRQERESAEEVARRAASDETHLADLERSEALTRQVEGLEAVATQLEAAQAELAGLTVTPQVLRELDEAETTLGVLRARHEVASASLDLRSLAPEGTQVLVDGEPVTVAEGECLHRPLTGDVTVEVPGLLRLRLTPEQSSRERAAELAAAQTRLDDLLSAAGVVEVEQARGLQEDRAAAAARVQRLRDRVADLSTGVEPEELDRRLSELAHDIQSYAGSRPDDYPLPADVEQARAVRRAAETERRHAGEAAVAAAEELRAAAAGAQQAEVRLARVDSSSTALRERLDRDRQDLADARRKTGDEGLQEAATRLATEHAQLEAGASQARRELADADPEGVREVLARAEQELADHRHDLARVREQSIQVSAQVQMAAGEGRAEAYDRALTRFDDARAELRAVDRRARAARQLRDTLHRHREEAHRAYVRPYAEEIDRLGRLVYGETFSVDVAEDLTITARRLEGTLVPFDQLSGGAKEQLGILARLAVAGLVDREQGVPVIIDDALGYTDPERLHRVGAVFDGPAERTQVILLTCTPERYRQIPHATTIQLGA